MSLKEAIQKQFGYADECFGNYESDLHVLPHSHEMKAVRDFIVSQGHTATIVYSNVEGQDWYGRYFIEVPFAAEYDRRVYKP